jgi:opacity protein-like surface antigen
MSKRGLLAGALAAIAGALVVAEPAVAQRGAGASVEVAPYAGYMLFDDFVDGPLGTSIGGANGPVYGVQLALPLTRHVALVGNVGYADSELRVGVPIVGGLGFGDHKAVLYDGGIQLSGGGRIAPFVQAGLGGMYQKVSVSGLSTDATSFVYSVGGGLDVAITRNVGLRLMAKDYAGEFDFEEATFIDIERGTMHNIALSAGLRFHF